MLELKELKNFKRGAFNAPPFYGGAMLLLSADKKKRTPAAPLSGRLGHGVSREPPF